jgi:APA family basic amino acid/polyamine antiporter
MSTGDQQGRRAGLGLRSGVGLVLSSIVGSVVWVSAAYMVGFGRLSPGAVLLAWVLGGLLALAGALAYASAVRAVPGGGGEYRLLSAQWHPFVGFVAGWASLVFGFAAPAALDARMAAAYLHAAGHFAAVDARWVATVLLVVLVAIQLVGLEFSRRANDAVFLFKASVVVLWLGAGLWLGRTHWPQWTEGDLGFHADAFASNLFYVMLGYSGWNAAIYAADEFSDPRDVPRAMVAGCLIAMALYLLINLVFVSNVPAQAMGAGTERTWTLAHVVMDRLAGPGVALAVSGGMVVIFVGSLSALFFAGPRIFARMAADGMLPRVFASPGGRPPGPATLLQGAAALLLVWWMTAYELLESISQILVLFTGLVCAGVAWMHLRGRARSSLTGLVAGGLFAVASSVMLWLHPPPARVSLLALVVPALLYPFARRRGGLLPLPTAASPLAEAPAPHGHTTTTTAAPPPRGKT